MQLPKMSIPNLRLSITKWWLVALSCVVIVGAAIIVHALVLFMGAFKADIVTEGADVPVESISRETLKETISVFEARRRRFESIAGTYDATPKAPEIPATTTATSTQ
jgi:hypothetical protein